MKLNSLPLQQKLASLAHCHHQLIRMSSSVSMHQTEQLQAAELWKLSRNLKECANQFQHISQFISDSLFTLEQTETKISSYGKQCLNPYWDKRTVTGSMSHSIHLKHDFSLEDGFSLGAYANWSGEGHLIDLEHRKNYDKVAVKANIGLGNLRAKLKAEGSILEDGKWKPRIDLKAEVGGSLAVLQGSAVYTGKHAKAMADIKGEVGVAKAEAKAVISKEEISAKAEWSVAAVRGEAHGAISFFGFRIDATLGGEAFGAGAGAQFSRKKNSFEIGGKLSFIFGLDLKLKISKDGKEIKEVSKKKIKE